MQEAGLALAYGDYVDALPAVRVAALAGLVDLALCSVRLTDLLTLRVEETTKERAQRLKQTQVWHPSLHPVPLPTHKGIDHVQVRFSQTDLQLSSRV